MSLNYVFQNFPGLLNYTTITNVSILETAVASSADVPTFYAALTTPQGMIFVQDIAQATSPTSITFDNFPLGYCGNSVGYTAAGVYYFYYLIENLINVYNCNTQTNSVALSIPGGPYTPIPQPQPGYPVPSSLINIVGSTMYVSAGNTVYQMTIGGGGVLTLQNSFSGRFGVGILSAVGLDANRVFIGLNGGGYAVYNFSTQIYTVSSIVTSYVFNEVVLCGSYVVGTNGSSIYQEPIASMFTDAQTTTSLAFMGIYGSRTISGLKNAVSGKVLFYTGTNTVGGGIVTFDLTTTMVTSTLNQSTLGDTVLQNLQYFNVTPDGNTFIISKSTQCGFFKLKEKLYTWTGIQETSQSIYRSLQGRLKLLAQFPTGSTATASVSLLDENAIPLMNWSVASGLVTTTGAIGQGTAYCYFDAPLGMTNQSFQFQVTSDANEVVSIYLEEVAE